jgi:hypothetical protein
MEVSSTKVFKMRFSSQTIHDKFIENFRIWKESPDENSSFYFGKDGGYREPKLSSGYLMHVHTIPIPKPQREVWSKCFENGWKRTSDGVLVYVQNSKSFLLIDWVKDGGHILADYSEESKVKLKYYATIAEKFLNQEEITENES